MSHHQFSVQHGLRLHCFHSFAKKGVLFFFSLAILFIAPQRSLSQQSLTEEKEIYLRIDDVFTRHDTVTVLMANVDRLGIKKGDIIKGWQAFKYEVPGVSPERNIIEVGAGKIFLTDSVIDGILVSAGFIKLYNPSDSLEIGDLITITISVPQKSSENIFAQLAFQNIIFSDMLGDPLYQVQDFTDADHILPEDSVYKRAETDFREIVELGRKNLDRLSGDYKNKLTVEKFKDQTLLDVMDKITRKDVRSFLLYAMDYPGNYQGKNYQINSSFGGWIVVNAPHGATELKNLLLPIYKNKILFSKQLLLYKNEIVSEPAIQIMINQALNLSNSYRYKDAGELADFVLSLAYAVNDTVDLPWAHIVRAEIYQEKGQYQLAIPECDKASETAKKVGNRDIELQAMAKKAYCFVKIKNFPQANNILATATKKLYEYQSEITNQIFLKNAVKIFEQRYSVGYNSGDYKMAFQFIDSVIHYDSMMNTSESVLRNASYLKFKGEVYNAQGQPLDAVAVLQKALDIYADKREIISIASTENEMAKSYFNLKQYENCIAFAKDASEKHLLKNNYSEAAFSYSWIGQSEWNLYHYDSALRAHSTAIQYAEQAKDTFRIAWSWQKVGELYKQSGEKNIALGKFDTSVYYFSAVKDSSGLADVYSQKGLVYLNDENYKTAIQFFEKAKGMSKTDEEGFYNLGLAWRSVDTTKSRKYFEECRRQSIQDSNTYYHFRSSQALAKLTYYSKNFSSGQRYYDECVKISQQLKQSDHIGYCLLLKGYEFEMKISLDSAIEYYKRAADIFTTADKSEKVYCLDNMANVFISLGEFAMAEASYKEAISLARSISDQIALGYTLSNSVFLYGRTGEFEKGLSNSDSAFSIFRKSGNHLRLADAYFNIASLLGSSGEFKKAIQSYLTADSIYKAELINSMRSVIYNNIGVVYRNQEDWVKALKNFDQSINLLPKGIVNESYLLSQGNKAECLHYLKRSKEAEKLLLQILPQATKLNLNRIASGMAVTMGDIYLANKKFVDAKNSYTNALNYALASGEKEKIIETLTGIGRINKESKNFDQAEKNFRQAISVLEEMNGTKGWECYYELGLMYLNRSKYDSAANYFKKAITFLEKNMENLFGGENAKKIFNNDPRKADLYNKITFAYYKLGDITNAWEYANRYNLAGLREFSGAISVTSPDKQKQEALQKIFSAQKELQELKATGDKLQGAEKEEILSTIRSKESEFRNLINDMADKYNDLAVYFNDVRARDLKTYKESIPEDMAVLIYMQHENTLLVISLTHDSLAMDMIAVNPKQLVQTFIESAKSGLLSMRQGTVEDAIKTSMNLSDKLYRMLIAPLSDLVKSKKRYCIVPTSFYSNLPFQCLGNYGPDNEFHYLIEGHSIFYVTDVSIFRKNQAGNIRNDFSSFAAFGVPDSKLHYNLTEVANIGKIVGYDSTIYPDERATKNKAIQNLLQKKVIHFSTHGILSFEKYSLSYLKLMPDKDNDGRLTMQEVNSLTIPPGCDMVVLSACETAVNKTLANGWNISPANAFLESNVRTVVASLWKVFDEATGILMENFYTNLKSMEIVDKAEALRLAQLELMKNSKFAHPNYWGAFALYGDWR